VIDLPKTISYLRCLSPAEKFSNCCMGNISPIGELETLS